MGRFFNCSKLRTVNGFVLTGDLLSYKAADDFLTKIRKFFVLGRATAHLKKWGGFPHCRNQPVLKKFKKYGLFGRAATKNSVEWQPTRIKKINNRLFGTPSTKNAVALGPYL